MGVNLLTTSTAAIGTATRPAGETVQATVVGTGAVSAAVAIEVSNDGVGWITLGTISASGTGTATDGFAWATRWSRMRANCSAVTGEDAVVSVTVGD